MSKQANQVDGAAPAAAPKPKNKSKLKLPGSDVNINFSPVASAMFEIQRREATSNVISGAVCILVGLITIIFSIAKCRANLAAMTVDADKILAYAWIVFAVAGVCLCLIGVYEILKSFISMEQIAQWTQNAESHVTPLQAVYKRKAEKLESEASAESEASPDSETSAPPPQGSPDKKSNPLAMSGTKLHEKAAPRPAAPAPSPAKPPKHEPEMRQKFDYGIHEAKKKTFADKFLEENQEDPFEQYRRDLGIEETPPPPTEQKPQFIRRTDSANSGFVGDSPQSSSGFSEFTDDDFFFGSKVTESEENISMEFFGSQSDADQGNAFENIPADQDTQPLPTVKPPAAPIPGSQPLPTVKPPAPPEPGSQPLPTVKPPAPPEPGSQPIPTVKPPAPPEKGSQQMPVATPPQQTVYQQSPQSPQIPGGYMQQMPPLPQYPMGQGMYSAAPAVNMYQPLPNIQAAPGMMQSNFVSSPFGYVGAFNSMSESPYNSAMPPYTMHPFRPGQPPEQMYNPAMPPYTVHGFKSASGEIAAPTVGDASQNQA